MTLTKYIFFPALVLLAYNSSAQKRMTVSVSGKISGHTYVDLGLPSHILWATCNVGTKKATGYGNYIAWGETAQKDDYRWKSYEWGHKRLLKYCHHSEFGVADYKSVLEADDDVATRQWGSKWRMPSFGEMKELQEKCDWTWTDDFGGTGVSGAIGKSQINGKIIFFPAAGYYGNSDLVDDGIAAYYWTSSLCEDDYGAHAVIIKFDKSEWKGSSRYCGYSIRPVVNR